MTKADRTLLKRINQALAAEDMFLEKSPKVRHLLDVLVSDIGAGAVADKVENPLKELTIAPYYGCQCLRPYAVFDDPEEPVTMDAFIKATGADVFQWDEGARCCGASHMNTKPEVGLALVTGLLEAARGADAILTVCPMCQMNLEGFQAKATRAAGKDLSIPVLYLPQFLGLALGLDKDDVRLDLNLAVSGDFFDKANL